MAIRTKSELMNLITSGLANNTTGAITADILRNLVIDIVDSCFNEPAPSKSLPPGTIIYVAMPNAPDGYLKANAQEVSRTVYADLFNAIGTRFGVGNGSTTFTLPDLRGIFIRGWADNHVTTADAGRAFGSYQDQGICFHEHTIENVSASFVSGVPGTESGPYTYIGAPVMNQQIQITKRMIVHPTIASNEVRPYNIALLGCIKY